MNILRASRRRVGAVALSAAVLLGGGLGIAAATTSAAPQSNAMSHGRGINEFGMTKAFYAGKTRNFTYNKGFFCDTKVSSAASSACEAGASYIKAPAKDFDPLYITVPLGFTEPMNMLECPDALVCVDHPGSIDLSRLEPALKGLYPTLTDAQLTAALKNFAVPGHDHFITTTNAGQAEWWDVRIIGVTSRHTYEEIREHKSFAYINHLLKEKNKTVVGPIPTNLFLFFSVQK
jgi:hypothetical protein